MSFTVTITCPHCQTEIQLEVDTRYDEPDDIEIKVVKENSDKR